MSQEQQPKLKSINQELQQRVSLETGIPLEVVKQITEFEGKYTANVIREGLFEGVIWPYLGKIKAPIEKVQKKNEDKGKPHYLATEKPKKV